MPATLPCPKMPKQPAKKRLLRAVALDILLLAGRRSAPGPSSAARFPLAHQHLPANSPADVGSRAHMHAQVMQVMRRIIARNNGDEGVGVASTSAGTMSGCTCHVALTIRLPYGAVKQCNAVCGSHCVAITRQKA